jgi:hypothetical protein
MADKPAWVGQYLPSLQRLGMSATAALRTFRGPADEGGLGLHVSTSEFYRQWAASINELAKAEGFLSVNLSRKPTDDQITAFPSRQATGYSYYFNALVRDQATNETYYRPISFRTDTLVSFAKAKGRALDALTAAAAEYAPLGSGIDVLGAVPVSVRNYLPAGSA